VNSFIAEAFDCLSELHDCDVIEHGEAITATDFSFYGDGLGGVERCDGLIIVTPEYNHSFPGLLKHALETSEPRWRGISGTRLKINAWGVSTLDYDGLKIRPMSRS
jgi:multimeric flavodoxin WrbA